MDRRVGIELGVDDSGVCGSVEVGFGGLEIAPC